VIESEDEFGMTTLPHESSHFKFTHTQKYIVETIKVLID
jgi:hypothetical protein